MRVERIREALQEGVAASVILNLRRAPPTTQAFRIQKEMRRKSSSLSIIPFRILN